MPDYLNREHQDIRRILGEISEIYAAAADAATIGEMRTLLGQGRAKLYDVEFRVYRAFTQQGRDRARADGA